MPTAVVLWNGMGWGNVRNRNNVGRNRGVICQGKTGPGPSNKRGGICIRIGVIGRPGWQPPGGSPFWLPLACMWRRASGRPAAGRGRRPYGAGTPVDHNTATGDARADQGEHHVQHDGGVALRHPGKPGGQPRQTAAKSLDGRKARWTPLYKDLQELHKGYRSRLKVMESLGNQFGGQEPGTAADEVLRGQLRGQFPCTAR